jgi:hypothetical protein
LLLNVVTMGSVKLKFSSMPISTDEGRKIGDSFCNESVSDKLWLPLLPRVLEAFLFFGLAPYSHSN